MKTYVILNVQGGVPSDPEVFFDRAAAIARYVECAQEFSAPTCAHQVPEGNICEHEFPHPTVETFDAYFQKVICPDCGQETDLSEFGHGDDDLYFYDGIETGDFDMGGEAYA